MLQVATNWKINYFDFEKRWLAGDKHWNNDTNVAANIKINTRYYWTIFENFSLIDGTTKLMTVTG
jgi:hypothetical protein